jgi:chromate transporter
MQNRATLKDLFRFFLTLGVTAFGGPVAHLAIMQREAVEKRGWMSKHEFVDVIGLLNLIPGPNSTQMTMYFGFRHGGIPGMLVSGLSFILPAAAITLVLAWVYVTYGALPEAQAVLWGIQPVVIGVIASAMWRLVPQAIKSWTSRVFFAAALVASLLGVSEFVIILGIGAIAWAWFTWGKARFSSGTSSIWPFGLTLLTGVGAASHAASIALADVFWVFMRMALVLYGSGYLLVAYMQADLVDRLGWLSMQQMLDVLAIGQMTPGPFLTTATAAGVVIAGFPAALAATVGIFLPSFFLIGLLGGRVQALRESTWGKHFLLGVNAAVVAVLLMVSLRFAAGIGFDPVRLAMIALTLLALEKWKINSMVLLSAGAIIGLLF